MKTIATTVCMLFVHVAVLFGQNEPEFDPGVTWSIQAGKERAGQEVGVTVKYKDFNDNTIYSELHTGTIDPNGFLSFIVGKGFDQLPPPPAKLTPEDFAAISTFCWEIFFFQDAVTIDGMQAVTAAPKANVAAHALNTEAVASYIAHFDQTMTVEEFIREPPDKNRSLLGISKLLTEPGTINPIELDNFVHTEMATNPVTKELQEYFRIGNGNKTPLVLGDQSPSEVKHTWEIQGSLDEFLHILGLQVSGGSGNAPHSPTNHNTAALFADNSEREMSAGVLANAQTWGVYGTAQNGVVGITNGPNNGAGITGFVATPPDVGGFKYALYGHSNSQPSSWGAAIFGNGFHTGTWIMSSDARLKTEIRTQSNALDKVMQLRPSSYTYRQDTPYGLPEGLHHGFLAQDVETIFPELVSDIRMPLSLDPQEIYKSETTEYKGINYIEMIAILTSALQELNANLNAKIDLQAKEIVELRAKLNARAN